MVGGALAATSTKIAAKAPPTKVSIQQCEIRSSEYTQALLVLEGLAVLQQKTFGFYSICALKYQTKQIDRMIHLIGYGVIISSEHTI